MFIFMLFVAACDSSTPQDVSPPDPNRILLPAEGVYTGENTEMYVPAKTSAHSDHDFVGVSCFVMTKQNTDLAVRKITRGVDQYLVIKKEEIHDNGLAHCPVTKDGKRFNIPIEVMGDTISISGVRSH